MATPRASHNAPTGADLADELWTPAHLAAYLHCGRSTAYVTVNLADFPTPVVVGPHRRLWVGGEVRDWALSTRRAPARTPATVDAARDGAPSRHRRRSR